MASIFVHLATYIPVSGLLLVAAITPGPNNLIVMERASKGGLRAAVRPIVGVVCGSLLLLALGWIGIDLVRRSIPRFEFFLASLGALYLLWLGTQLALRSEGGKQLSTLPGGVGGVALFQLANPKAWVLVLTSLGAISATGNVAVLAVLITIISILCLAVWAILGVGLAAALKHPRTRTLFDLAMGALLILSAAGVLIDGIR